ncbi:MAG: hypothetical protein KAI53_00350 [Candidatus Aenigmarchaeota archaeon]|nr:hypothetical protein [Candidatus Aenigmarchaeota archaeon]
MNTTATQSTITAVPDAWISILLLALFLFVAFSILKVIKNTIIMGLLACVFPFISNKFLGTAHATDLSALLNFAIIGIAIYMTYFVMKLLYHSSKLAFKVITLLLLPLKILLDLIKSIFSGKKKKK